MLAVIEHINNWHGLLMECNRILEKNGKIVITTPLLKAAPLLDAFTKIGLVDRKQLEDHKHYFSLIELEKEVTTAGFNIIHNGTFELGYNIIFVGVKI